MMQNYAREEEKNKKTTTFFWLLAGSKTENSTKLLKIVNNFYFFGIGKWCWEFLGLQEAKNDFKKKNKKKFLCPDMLLHQKNIRPLNFKDMTLIHPIYHYP